MERYALVIGITDYDNQAFTSLPQITNNAMEIADLLEKNRYNVTKLISDINNKKLYEELKNFLEVQACNHEALIYFTGHGFLVNDLEDKYGCLATSNCKISYDKNNEISGQTDGFKLITLNKILEKVQVKSLVMLIDTCHSGYFLKNEYVKETLTNVTRSNYFLIAACREHQESTTKKNILYLLNLCYQVYLKKMLMIKE